MDNESTATSTLTGTDADDNAAINALLSGGEGAKAEGTSETEHKTGDHTEEHQPERTEESEEAAAKTEETTEEEVKTEETEEAEEESELSIDESDRDYSAAAYDKAAKHYSRTHGVQLNPEDPAHRALLKEVMDRGEALKQQKAEAAKPKADEAKTATEEVKTEPIKLTPEQIQAGIHDIEEIAKSRIVPEVSMHVATRFVKALWPNEDIKLTQEQANDLVSGLHSFFLMALNDAAPAVYGMVNGSLAQDPVWGPARTEAIEARAFEHLDKTKGADWFASMETLVENGSLKKVIAENPDIFKNIKAGDGRDPVLNRAAQLEAAYKIARGDQTIQQVTKAVETGKKQATDSAKKIAAGRVGAGTPKSGFNKGPGEGQTLINNIVGGEGSGSKFSRAVATQLRK